MSDITTRMNPEFEITIQTPLPSFAGSYQGNMPDIDPYNQRVHFTIEKIQDLMVWLTKTHPDVLCEFLHIESRYDKL